MKTLKFTFEAPKKGGKKSTPKKAEPAEEVVPEPIVVEVPAGSDTYTAVALPEEEKRQDVTVDDSSLMTLAKSLTGE